MPLFMDMHTIEGGVSVADVASAHKADLETRAKYGVSYLRYWVDDEAGKILCLIEADDAEAANTVHTEAHGLVADAIYPVSEHRCEERLDREDENMKKLIATTILVAALMLVLAPAVLAGGRALARSSRRIPDGLSNSPTRRSGVSWVCSSGM